MTDDAHRQSCCGHTGPGEQSLELTRSAPRAGTGGTDTAECPVMTGTVVDKSAAVSKGLYRDFEGTRYYLCCAGCGPRFDADPHKYATAASA